MPNSVLNHGAYETIHQSEQVSYVSQTTPSEVDSCCEVPAPLQYVVPIIVIPGIMGSNLRNSNKEKVWYPSIGTLIQYSKRDAKDRQLALNPKTTEVGYDGDIKINKSKTPHMTTALALERGWGSLVTTGYPNLLNYLESQLNNPFAQVRDQAKNQYEANDEWKKIVDQGTEESAEILALWNSQQLVELLSPQQHEALADYAFPVFACGYNWLQSNMDSADYIADRLNNEVMAQIKKEFPRLSFKKFIIVTHSMGGLVTRALIQNEKVKDQIAGVIHGVMPASGAPTVYQRLSVGWDGWQASTGLFNRFKAWITKFMFGDTSERLTATLASAPGGLELLPFPNYSNRQDYPDNPKAWLLLKANTPQGEITASLPKTNDPYTEIYQRKDSWWAMMNPDFIDPAGLLNVEAQEQKLESAFDLYVRNIEVARELHSHILDVYHDNSYAHYAEDSQHKSYGQVVWRCEEQLNICSEHELIELMGLYGTEKPTEYSDATDPDQSEKQVASQFQANQVSFDAQKEKITSKNNAYKKDGIREIILAAHTKISKTNTATFHLDIKPSSAGDGTVCYQSGQDVRAAKRALKNSFVINGYEHSASYDHELVQLNTIYCIAHIVDSLKKA